ncbi:MAG: murein biosynthesis integral membrane protein MurJ [Candidatus Gastranaerophilales bacterium]|nr:murein biosynthesis integral membrane protein MurJ [Candidatus Gastranaerophilales bacterium]
MRINLFKTAGLVAALTIISKIFGFWRDLAVANAYGASMVSDAFFYSYQIPSLALILLGGVGGPFHTATISFFSKYILDYEVEIPKSALRIFNSFVTLTAVLFGLLSIICYFFPEQIIRIIAGQASDQLVAIATSQLRVMSPIILIGGVIGIFYGIANVYREFITPSLGPIFVSIGMIVALWLFPDDPTGNVLSWGFLVGAVGQLLFQLPSLLKNKVIYRPEFAFCSDDMRKIGEVLFPAILSTTIGQINVYIDMFFTSGLEEGAWSAISYSNRLYQFPTGVLITAFLVPLFPMFSTFIGQKDWTSLKVYFNKGVSTLWFLAFPICMFMFMFAKDSIYLLFERGAFDSYDTVMVTKALLFLSISIIPYVARDTLTRVFYSFDDSRTPFMVAACSIGVKVLMNFLCVGRFGMAGITLATTAVTFFNMFMLGSLLLRKIDMEYKKLISPLLKTTAITFIVYFIGVFIKSFFDFHSKLYLSIELVSVLVLCSILYFAFALWFKIPVAQEILARVKK